MPALTRSDLQSRISQLIGDPNSQEFSSSAIQNQIQSSMEKFVEDTRALTDTQSFSIVAGTNTYALSTDTLDILRVTLNGLPLQRMSKFDLDVKTHANWAATSGTPKQFFVDYTSTNKNLTTYPIPAAGDVGTNNLVAEYVKVPPTLSNDSDYPLNNQTLLRPYLMALAYDAAAYFLLIRDDPKYWAKASNFKKLYDEQVSDCKELFSRMNQTSPRRMRGGRYFLDR